MSDVADKIAKLLRLALDREGTPEGDTVMARARALMEAHGIEVDLEDDESDAELDAPDHPDDGVIVGMYPGFVSWRTNLVTLVQMIYQVAAWWTFDEDASILFMAEGSTGEHGLACAMEFFVATEQAICTATFSIRPNFRFRGTWGFINLANPRDRVIVQQGLAEAHLASVYRYAARRWPHMSSTMETLQADIVASHGSPAGDGAQALVRITRFSRPRSDRGSMRPPEARVPEEASVQDLMDRAIYEYASACALHVFGWPVPPDPFP